MVQQHHYDAVVLSNCLAVHDGPRAHRSAGAAGAVGRSTEQATQAKEDVA
jgi:hypothetical protein